MTHSFVDTSPSVSSRPGEERRDGGTRQRSARSDQLRHHPRHLARRGWMLAALLALAPLLVGCQQEDDGAPAPAERKPTQCEAQFGSDCGAACDADTPCAAGLHCAAGKCSAECIEDTDCERGRCSGQGRCEEIDGIGIDPVFLDPTRPEDEVPQCVEGDVKFEAVVPQVWMLLDRSGSMTSSLGDVSRWQALGRVLLGDPEDSTDRGVVGEFEARAAFGATFYTTGYGTGGCVLDLESVALATGNYTAIRQRYNKLTPTGGTPTADAIAAVVAVAATSDLTGGPKILVLATDGEPGACAPRSGAATTEVEREVELAFAKRIQTFVVSIARETNAAHMQRVANLGAGLPADAVEPAPYYTADSQEELALAFTSIIQQVPRSCVFSLNGEVDAAEAGEGEVTLAGRELVYNDPDGWVLAKPDQVEIVGAACEEIRAGEEDLDITFPCSVFTPIIK